MYTIDELNFLEKERSNPNITGCARCEYGHSRCDCQTEEDDDFTPPPSVLNKEINRVLELQKIYDSLPNCAGSIASMNMQYAIDVARKAQSSGDILQMMSALEALLVFER